MGKINKIYIGVLDINICVIYIPINMYMSTIISIYMGNTDIDMYGHYRLQYRYQCIWAIYKSYINTMGILQMLQISMDSRDYMHLDSMMITCICMQRERAEREDRERERERERERNIKKSTYMGVSIHWGNNIDLNVCVI